MSDQEAAEAMAKHLEKKKAERMEKYDEFHRRKVLTQEERSRQSIDKLTKNFKENAEKNGQYISGEAAHRAALGIAQEAERKRK
jgi:hypothetical protein